MLLRESLGISADGSEKAFAQRDVEDMLKRVPPPIAYSARDPTQNTQHVFLAVDPSGGPAEEVHPSRQGVKPLCSRAARIRGRSLLQRFHICRSC